MRKTREEQTDKNFPYWPLHGQNALSIVGLQVGAAIDDLDINKIPLFDEGDISRFNVASIPVDISGVMNLQGYTPVNGVRDSNSLYKMIMDTTAIQPEEGKKPNGKT